MPYIAIRAYPKDDETKRAVVERINQVFLDLWGCPPEAVSISLEEIRPEDWQEKVGKAVMEPALDNMMILRGRKTEKMNG